MPPKVVGNQKYGDGPATTGPQSPAPKADVEVDQPNDGPFDICVDGPNKSGTANSKVYYGTKLPTHVPLTPGQIMAVGNFYGCSGTLIAPRWVLSARHCGLSSWSEFCMGPDPSNPSVCIDAKRVLNHGGGDIALVELKADARDLLPGVEPIVLFTDKMDASWKGRIAEAGGYGQQETGYSNTREFTAEPISWLGSDTLTINGEGVHGVCYGDSGGPVMVIAADGSPRVAGALSNGDSSCVGYDNYTRVDVYFDWLTSYTGPVVPPGPQQCSDTTFIGTCSKNADRATWCDGQDELQVDHCAAGTRCSWSNSDEGFRCVTPAQDACAGLDHAGKCDDNVLTWCDIGGPQKRDCGACEETCVPDNNYSNHCVPSTCGDLGFVAQCDGDTVRRCGTDGQLQEVDCGSYGDTCDYVNHIIGSWCVAEKKPSPCGDLSFYGYCDGKTAHWCNRQGVPENRNCGDSGQICGWVDTATGFYCKN